MSLSDDIHFKMKVAEEGFILTIKVRKAVKDLNIILQNWKVIPDYQLLKDKIDSIFGEKLI